MLKRSQLNQAFKKKYFKNAIHHSADQFGAIQVIDDGRVRSLHFDAVEKQSAMDLEHPENLILSYTVYMMSGFLFNPSAARILCIGLGGASIPRFLAHFLSACRVDVVEIRQEVIDIARKYFFLPNDQRFRYFKEDAATFVVRQDLDTYDMILVDAYDEQGVATSVTESRFFHACAAMLAAKGIFCINIWSHPSHIYHDVLQEIRNQFGSWVFELAVKDRTNRIILGVHPEGPKPSLQLLKKRSQTLESELKLPFFEILKSLVKNNSALFKAIKLAT